MRNSRSGVIALATFASLTCDPARALVNGTVDANTTTSPWAGVVSLSTASGEVYSGALIDRSYVLTAAHVAAGHVNNPAGLTININYGGNRTQQIAASQIFVHPDFKSGAVIGNGSLWNDDIAVIRLAQPAAVGVPVYSLSSGTIGTTPNGFPTLNGQPVAIALAGYGGYSDGVSGSVQINPNAAVKRVGTNRMESLYAADAESIGTLPPAGLNEGFVFDLDAGIAGEAGYAGGDSGGPVFVDDQGVWRIVGVAAFNGTLQGASNNSLQFGAIGGGMLIAPYAGWIQQQITAAVPEPDTYALMLAGLGLVAAAALRRPQGKRLPFLPR